MRLAFLITLVFLSSWTKAQKMDWDVSYAYLYAKAWDNNVQTYNFSRPFLENPQPLLQHGLGSSFTYIFNNERKIQHGIAYGLAGVPCHAVPTSHHENGYRSSGVVRLYCICRSVEQLMAVMRVYLSA